MKKLVALMLALCMCCSVFAGCSQSSGSAASPGKEAPGTDKKDVTINILCISTTIADIISKEFDLRPASIIKTLDLRRPIYKATAAYGHFGRPEFPWEKLDRVDDLKKYL